MGRARATVTGLLVLAAMVAGLLLLVWSQQRRMIYFPFGRPGSPARAGLPRAAEVGFPTEDGPIGRAHV